LEATYGRNWKGAASLPAAQRLERLAKTAEDFGAELTRRAVDAAALVDGRRIAQVGRKLFLLDRVPGHDAECLDMHDEVVGRPLHPPCGHGLDRKPVVGRVELDRVEVLGVVGEPLACREPSRIEVLRERFVRPRARADSDSRRHQCVIRTGLKRPDGG
jgi:hypothetical protein